MVYNLENIKGELFKSIGKGRASRGCIVRFLKEGYMGLISLEIVKENKESDLREGEILYTGKSDLNSKNYILLKSSAIRKI